MPAPFAALEAKANASVFKHIANAQAAFTPVGGGAVVVADVVFDKALSTPDESGVMVTRPALTVPVSAVPGLAQGYGVVINGVSYVTRAPQVLAEGLNVAVDLARV